MSILSDMTPDTLILAVVTEDVKPFKNVNGVGPKLAGRIILELKDKFKNTSLPSSPELLSAAASPSGNLSEAAEALCALGYSRSDAFKAVTATGFTDEDSVDLIIKKALRSLAK